MLLAGAVQAGPYIVDQQNDSLPYSGGFTFQANVGGPVGQSFAPTLSSLNVVELLINDQNPGWGGDVSIAVRIHDGGIGGSVLGTSQTVLFHDQVPQLHFQYPELVRFDFASSIVLTPGQTYTIEPYAVSGLSSLGVFGTGFGIDSYVAGESFFQGGIYAEVGNAPFDLWFREGLAPVPEPETNAMILAGLGLLGFMARRRKQAQVLA